MQSKRNYGVDLLRIALMFCIVAGHLYAHTKIRSTLPFLSGKWIFTWTTQAVTVCAVDCFVVITGYYMAQVKYDLYKGIKLWGKVIFYSVFLTVVLVAAGSLPLSLGVVLDALFPVLRQEYWFFTMYILLYLFVPFLNAGLSRMSKKMNGALVLIILLFFYLEPLLSAVFYEYDDTEGFSITAFITLYIIGAYLARCRDPKKRYCLLALAASSAIMFASKVVLEYIVRKYRLGFGTGLLYHNNSVFVLINAVALFELFKQLKLKPAVQKAAAWLSPSVFAVYLLHEKPAMREKLWNPAILQYLVRVNMPVFAISVIGIGAGILVAGILIDKLMNAFVFSRIERSRCARMVKEACEKYNEIIMLE